MIKQTCYVSDARRFVYVDIPKCASTALIMALSDGQLPFACKGRSPRQSDNGLREFNRAQIKEFRDRGYWVFTVVRNPFDRLKSLYTGRGQSLSRAGQEFRQRYGLRRRDSFSVFAKRICSISRQEDIDPHFESQFLFTLDEDGCSVVDHVATFESLGQDITQYGETLGLNVAAFHRIGKTSDTHYSAYYGAELLEAVKHRYADDLNAFGYEFERRVEYAGTPESRPNGRRQLLQLARHTFGDIAKLGIALFPEAYTAYSKRKYFRDGVLANQAQASARGPIAGGHR